MSLVKEDKAPKEHIKTCQTAPLLYLCLAHCWVSLAVNKSMRI